MRIGEVELLPNYGSSSRYRHHSVQDRENPYSKAIQRGEFRVVTRVKGHTIYYKHAENAWKGSEFIAVDDDTDTVDMHISYNDALEEPGGREIMGMKLVAHRKIGKHGI